MAVQVTRLVPKGKVCGELMTVFPIRHRIVGIGLPVAVGAKLTDCEQTPGVASTVTLAGQVMPGAVPAAFQTTPA